MGMYDSVVLDCPMCGTHVKVQSKAGECSLKDFEQNAVPTAIALAIAGELVECESCKRVWKVTSTSPTFVRCRLVRT